MGYIYLYGMIMATESFLLYDEYPKPDGYGEIKRRDYLLGGETGTASAVLASLGMEIVLGGTHLGDENVEVINNYFKDKAVDTSKLIYQKGFQGIIDYVIIDKNTRTCFGMWGKHHSRKSAWYEEPDEESVKNCSVVGADPYFGEKIVELCRKYDKKYATIDCPYDSNLNKYCSVNAISHQYLKSNYANMDIDELYKQYTDTSNGLIIFTQGENEVIYGRKGSKPRYFKPFRVNVMSTLGAGDSFKAGTIYGLNQNMGDDDLVRFASATAGIACSAYPIALNPPTLEKVKNLISTE